MAWTTPAAPGASTLVTNSFWTTQVTNNFNETAPAKVTTIGDTVYAAAANSITRLALGAQGAVYVAGASTPKWTSQGTTASGGGAKLINLGATITGSANSDNLQVVGMSAMTWAKGTLSGLTVSGIVVDGTGWGTTGTGSISTVYGIYLSGASIGATNWALYNAAGNVVLTASTNQVFIGDTANANVTSGLTINGGTADEQVSLKLTGLAHGVTGATETDTYLHVGPLNSSKGGAFISAYESFASTFQAIVMRGVQSVADTTRSTAAIAPIELRGAFKNGTSASNLAANSNVLTISDNGTVHFVFDSDGDLSADAALSASAFDRYDDAALCRALDVAISDPATLADDTFRDWMKYKREDLERAKLVTFNQDGHHFVNYTKLARLHTGAIWQQETKVRQMAAEIQELRGQLAESRDTIAALSRMMLGPSKGD